MNVVPLILLEPIDKVHLLTNMALELLKALNFASFPQVTFGSK